MIFYNAMMIINKKTGKDPLEVFEGAFRNVMPMVEVRPRRVGGVTYQVPMEVRPTANLTSPFAGSLLIHANAAEKPCRKSWPASDGCL